MSALGTNLPVLSGAERQLHPYSSDLDLFRDIKCIVDFDAEVPHRAFDLRVAEKQLNSPQISGAPG